METLGPISYGGRVGGSAASAASAALSSQFEDAAAGRTRSEAMATPDREEEVPAGEQASENDEPEQERMSNNPVSACGL